MSCCLCHGLRTFSPAATVENSSAGPKSSISYPMQSRPDKVSSYALCSISWRVTAVSASLPSLPSRLSQDLNSNQAKEKKEKNNMGDSVSSVPSITVIILNGFRGTGTPKERRG